MAFIKSVCRNQEGTKFRSKWGITVNPTDGHLILMFTGLQKLRSVLLPLADKVKSTNAGIVRMYCPLGTILVSEEHIERMAVGLVGMTGHSLRMKSNP